MKVGWEMYTTVWSENTSGRKRWWKDDIKMNLKETGQMYKFDLSSVLGCCEHGNELSAPCRPATRLANLKSYNGDVRTFRNAQ
jgi:hypothetical protein